MNPIPPPPPQTPSPNNVRGTQNNVGGDQYNAAHDQFVANRDVSVVENNQGVINQHPVNVAVNQGLTGPQAGAKLGCVTVNIAVTVVGSISVLFIGAFLALNFLVANPDLTGINVGGDIALRGPGMAAPLAAGPTNGWAVGKRGAILYYDGEWHNYGSSPTTNNLNALSYDGSNGWIVGDGGTILHIGQNQSVAPAPSPTKHDLVSVAGVNEAVAVDNGGGIYRFDGRVWQSQPTMNMGLPPARVIAVGNGFIITAANGNLTPIDNPFQDLSMTPPSTQPSVEPMGGHIADVTLAPDHSTIWAVGSGGGIYKLEHNGWRAIASPTKADLHSIYFSPNGRGWAVGAGGVILSGKAEVWTLVSGPTSDNLNSVYVSTSGVAWAVGDKGRILRYDGTAWQKAK